MATERVSQQDAIEGVGSWEEYYNSAEFTERVARADADIAAGRFFDNVTPAALETFGHLDHDDAQRLLDNPDELRRWFAAHTKHHRS